MTLWIILGIIVLFLVLLCMLPVGVYVKYETQLLLRLLIGPFSMTLIPRKESEKSAVEEKQPAKKIEKNRGFQKPNREQICYSIETLPGIVKKALRRTQKGILIKPLLVKVIFAGEDPADVAQNYGKAQALVSALYPEIKKIVRIRKTAISLSADYEREQMELVAELGIHLRVGTILTITFSAGMSILRWFLGYRKLASDDHDTYNNEKHSQANAA